MHAEGALPSVLTVKERTGVACNRTVVPPHHSLHTHAFHTVALHREERTSLAARAIGSSFGFIHGRVEAMAMVATAERSIAIVRGQYFWTDPNRSNKNGTGDRDACPSRKPASSNSSLGQKPL
jgi:hypothetical protein